MAGIGYLNMNAEEFVAHCFTKEAFLASYDYTITPLNDSSMWPVTKLLAPLPPIKRRLPGRPQVKRRRVAAEKEISGSRQKLSRAGQTQRCSICKAIGHNKARCPSNAAGTSNENPTNVSEANVTQSNVSQATPHNEEEPASPQSEEEPESPPNEKEPATPQNEVPATQEYVNQRPSVRGRGRGKAAVRGRGKAPVRGIGKPPVVGRVRGRSERIAILGMKRQVVP